MFLYDLDLIRTAQGGFLISWWKGVDVNTRRKHFLLRRTHMRMCTQIYKHRLQYVSVLKLTALAHASCSFPIVSSVQMGSLENWSQDSGSRIFLSGCTTLSLGYSVFFRGNVHGEWSLRYSNKLNKMRVLGGWNGKHLEMSKKWDYHWRKVPYMTSCQGH